MNCTIVHATNLTLYDNEGYFGGNMHLYSLPFTNISVTLHCCKCWSALALKLLGNVHMCPSLCASMYTAPVYKGWLSSSFTVQGVSKLVHMLCTNWTLAWAHVYISKHFPSLGTPTSTAVLESFSLTAVRGPRG